MVCKPSLNLEPNFDLWNLEQEDLYKFMTFAQQSKAVYRRNFYYIGFFKYLKEIFKA